MREFPKVSSSKMAHSNTCLVEYQVAKAVKETNDIISFIRDFVIRIRNIDNRLQPLIDNAISSHTLRELKKLVEAAWNELQQMKLDFLGMENMVTTFKAIHETTRQASMNQLDEVVQRLRQQDQV